MSSDFRDIDPRELRVPSSRRGGADPFKLQMQIAKFGSSSVGMPPLIVFEGIDGVLIIYNGVTRATRIAKLAPGTLCSRRSDRSHPARLRVGSQNRRSAAMIPATQREALSVLAELCDLSPDVRFGQLLAMLGFLGEDATGRNLWEIEDDQLLPVLYLHRDDLLNRLTDSPTPAVSSTEKL